MYADGKLWIARGELEAYLHPQYANRRGLIAGAGGTGKTVTLKAMAEPFGEMGVPVFMADVIGDVSDLCRAGKDSEGMRERIEKPGVEGFGYAGFPCEFRDIYGEKGHPVRTTVDKMGADLFTRRWNVRAGRRPQSGFQDMRGRGPGACGHQGPKSDADLHFRQQEGIRGGARHHERPVPRGRSGVR